MKWDKKKGKFINAGSEGGKKFIRGEGGQRIAASFRSGRFDKWKAAHKVGNLKVGALEESGPATKRVLSAREFKHNKNEAPKRADKYRDDFHKQRPRSPLPRKTDESRNPSPRASSSPPPMFERAESWPRSASRRMPGRVGVAGVEVVEVVEEVVEGVKRSLRRIGVDRGGRWLGGFCLVT